jgi:hypothetical protein
MNPARRAQHIIAAYCVVTTSTHGEVHLFAVTAPSTTGNARWFPPISEYREAPGYTLHNAAKPMLQVTPPPAAPALTSATSQLLATGRLSLEGAAAVAMGLERPSTRERGQGRSPLTVLHSHLEEAAGGSGSPSGAAGPASGRVGGSGQTAAEACGKGAGTAVDKAHAAGDAASGQQEREEVDGGVGLKVCRRGLECDGCVATCGGA